MKRLLTLLALLIPCLALAQDAPLHSIPIGAGPGSQGFRFVGPCAAGQVPAWVSGVGADPTCANLSSASIVINTTTISGGTSGRVLYDNAGVIGEYTTVPIANGGTNATTYTTCSLVYYDGTSLTQDNANLCYNGATHRLFLGGATGTGVLNVKATASRTATFSASAAVSPTNEFIDGAGTPNRWAMGSGSATPTDGTFFIFDSRQNLTRLTIDASGIVTIPNLGSCQAGIAASTVGVLGCGGEGASIASYGGDCTGSGGSETALTNAKTARSTVSIPAGCQIRITTNTTFTAGGKLILPCGAAIAVDMGVTLTIRSIMPDPGECQIFNGAGTVTGLRFERPEYRGSIGNITNNDQPAIQAAVNSLQNSGASDGGRPTLQLAGGKCYGVTTPVTITPSNLISLEIAGAGTSDCSGGGTGSRILPKTLNTTAGIIWAGVGASSVDPVRLMSVYLHDFAVVAETNNGPTACIQLGTDGKFIDGRPYNKVENIYTAGCDNGWYVPPGAWINNMRFVNIDTTVVGLAATSVAFNVNCSGTGGAFGDIDFLSSNFEADVNTYGLVLRSSGTCVTIGGMSHFHSTFYGGLVSFYVIAENGRNVEDVFCIACQLDAGGGGGATGVKLEANGASSLISNFHFSDGFVAGKTLTGIWGVSSAGGAIWGLWVTNNIFTQIGATGGPVTLDAIGAGAGAHINGNTFSGNTFAGGAIKVNSASNVEANGNIYNTAGGAALTSVVEISGTSDYVNACFNNAGGTFGANTVVDSSGSTHNNGPAATPCFNH